MSQLQKRFIVSRATITVATLFFSVYGVWFYSPETASAALSGTLIQNGNFESGTAQNPTGWSKGSWGNNTAVFEYPVSGVSQSKAARVTMTARTSGDAKWAFPRIATSGGKEYEYRSSYTANQPTYITGEFAMADGTFVYQDLAILLPPTGSFTTHTVRFTAPSGAVSMRVFHLINRVGSLTIDNVGLFEVIPSSPPPSSNNLIANPSFEISGTNPGSPRDWVSGKWGTNTATFAYPVTGFDGNRAASVSMSQRTSGDAKWSFGHIPVLPNTNYRFEDTYKSTVTTYVTIEYMHSNGTKSYQDIGTLAPSAAWVTFRSDFTTPGNVVSLSIYHVINRVGTLSVDEYKLSRLGTGSPSQGGFISITFDDGWLSAYENGIPVLNANGIKSTNYIITERLSPNYSGYIKEDDMFDIYRSGHEIGSHTVTHANLTTLSGSALRAEVEDSREILLDMGITPVDSFSYPFGAYNTTVVNAVANAGYSSARTTDGGLNAKNQNPYTLKRFGLENTTSFSAVKNYIDQAVAQNMWGILAFHEINNSGRRYSTTPALFNQIIDYIADENVPTKTVSEGLESKDTLSE